MAPTGRLSEERAKRMIEPTASYSRVEVAALATEVVSLRQRLMVAWTEDEYFKERERLLAALRVAAPYVYQTVPPAKNRQADAKKVHAALAGAVVEGAAE